MHLYLNCLQCWGYGEFNTLYRVLINEEGEYNFTCKNQHENASATVCEKYELLYQIGAEAYLDGYYFEAVGCFISAFERFREWCIELIARINKVDKKYFEELWRKEYKNNSVAQQGAFYMMMLNRFKQEIPVFDSKKSAFRNSVIHKGIIPTEQEVYEFGEYVLRYVTNIQKMFHPKYQSEIYDMLGEKNNKKLDKFTEEQKGERKATIQNGQLILDIDRVRFETDLLSLRKHLEYLRDYRTRFHIHIVE